MPVMVFLRLMDSPMPVMGKVYHGFYQLQEHIKGIDGMDKDRQEQLEQLLVACWDAAHSPLHGAAYALDPEYQSHDFSEEACPLYMPALKSRS